MKALRIARLEVIAFLRQERVLLTIVALPLFQVAVVLFVPDAVDQRQAANEASARHEVVVSGDDSGEIARWLAAENFEVRSVGDALPVVADGRADAGVAVVGDVEAALRGEQRLDARVLIRVSSRSSVAAGTAAGRRLDELAVDITSRAADGAGVSPASAVGAVIESCDVSTTPAGRQGAFALVAPLVLALSLSGVTNVAAVSLSSAKDARVLEPLLLLPYRRSQIVAGKLVAAFAVGSAQAGVVAAGLLIGAVATSDGGSAVPVGAAVVPQLLVATAVLLTVGAALGVLLGAVARGSAVVTALAPVGGLLFVIVAFLLRAQGPSWGGDLITIPGIGALVLAREAVLERATWTQLFLAGAISSVTVVLFVAIAARLLESDRGVIRTTR